jgi:hypothetical protein
MRIGPRTAALAALAASVVLGGTSAIASEGRFLVDDRNPELNVPDEQQRAIHPREFERFLQDLRSRAETATGRGDHLAAARYYSALAKAVPDRSLAFARLCRSLEALGEREGALDACADALARFGVTVDDFVHYVRLILQKPTALTAADRRVVDDQIGMLRRNPAGTAVADQLQCELAMRLGDVALLRECTPVLAALGTVDPATMAALSAGTTSRWPEELGPLLVLVAVAGGASFYLLRRRAARYVD